MSEVKRFLAVEGGKVGGPLVKCVAASDYAVLQAKAAALALAAKNYLDILGIAGGNDGRELIRLEFALAAYEENP